MEEDKRIETGRCAHSSLITESQNHSQILVRYHRNISSYDIYASKYTKLIFCYILL